MVKINFGGIIGFVSSPHRVCLLPSCIRHPAEKSRSISLGMASFADGGGNTINMEGGAKGLNPGLVVLLVVVALLLIFFLGNYFLYVYAQKTLPPKRKKPVSKKKMRKERLRLGVSAPGE
ncbi:hypothetical protein KSP40_PGU018579 [Platanthera guangdongensis]|uniref:DNA-binding protein S1FA n=1 Tax=Platanthera guangdongensis TaxID=2320717 RepID=A0ABR2M008_9ASPA